MTLDEAIQYYIEMAEYYIEIAEEADQKIKRWNGDYLHLKKIDSCEKCAAEHRQIAEWLKELKQYRELFDSPEEASFVRTTFYEGALN